MHTDTENENGDSSRPATPAEEDCCHNNCEPCIFDVHRKLLEEYDRRKNKRNNNVKRKNVLCLTAYKPFKASGMTEIVKNYILVTLEYEGEERREHAAVFMEPGQHVILHAWGITRPFTPIAWSKKSLTLLVKLYSSGKFTSHLRDMEIGERISVRGPYGDFSYKRNSFQTVVMFSMGSGIAAHYPIAKAITDDDEEETRVHLVAGFQRIMEIPLRKELQNLSDYWNFQCTIHLSQLAGNETPSYHGVDIKRGRLNEESVAEILQTLSTHRTVVLICGRKEFNHTVRKWVENRRFENIYVFR